MSYPDTWLLYDPKVKPGMSFGAYLSQPAAVQAWQPTWGEKIVICKVCGNPCRGRIRWMPKNQCVRCPNGFDGGIP